MTRRLVLLTVIAILVALPLGAWAQSTLVKTADGTEFKFGIAEKVVGFSTADLDFHDRFNFRSITVPDAAFGDNAVGIFNFTNLLFTMEKGPLSIHANLEVEALIDENVADVNHLNLERANITYKLPTLGALTVGFDVHVFDPEGALIYQDEDPGIWLIGSNAPWSWNLGYHKRFERAGLGPLGRAGIATAPSDPDPLETVGKAVDTDILEARVGYDVKLPNGHLTVSPLLLAVIRRSPGGNTGADLAACPTDTCGVTSPDFAGRSGDKTDLYYPGVVVAGKVGAFMPTLEIAGLFGSVDGIDDDLFGGPRDMDATSYAIFAELAFDLSKAPSPMLAGLTPFISFEWHRGDDDPFDNDLEGFVSQSNLSSALRKDGFNKQSISSFGPPPLGAGGQAAWGFDVAGRGIGPTIGNIVESTAGIGGSAVAFNNRFGKADNPGFMKFSAGAVGKLAPQWDTHFAISYYRYDQTEPIEAEAAVNRLSRGAPCAGLVGVSLANARACANSLSVSKDMGVEINANVGYTINNFRIQPFVSVFIPGSAAEDINGLFTDIADDSTAYIAGVEFSARF